MTALVHDAAHEDVVAPGELRIHAQRAQRGQHGFGERREVDILFVRVRLERENAVIEVAEVVVDETGQQTFVTEG